MRYFYAVDVLIGPYNPRFPKKLTKLESIIEFEPPKGNDDAIAAVQMLMQVSKQEAKRQVSIALSISPNATTEDIIKACLPKGI